MAWKAPAGWKSKLLYKAKMPSPCTGNIALILSNDRAWQGVLALDRFKQQVVKASPPPWDGVAANLAGDDLVGDWTDRDSARLATWLMQKYSMDVRSATSVNEAVAMVATACSFHPIVDFLTELVWDGTERLDTFLIRLAGAEDTPYTRAVSSRFMIAAVARVFEPGCKVDQVPVLEGPQGAGKSTLLKLLAMTSDWFLETSVELGHKDSYQVIQRKWIVEMCELDSLHRAEISRIKAFISGTHDTFRPSYGQHVVSVPRGCVFAGTTNQDQYLKDDTGARRFQPIKIGRVKLKALKRERVQLWAEAVHRYRAKEKWHFSEASLREEAAKITEERRQADPWEALVQGYLSKRPRLAVQGVTTEEMLMALGVSPDRMSRADQTRVGICLRKAGWAPKQDWTGMRRYKPGATEELEARRRVCKAQERKQREDRAVEKAARRLREHAVGAAVNVTPDDEEDYLAFIADETE